jgi:putative hydroxymethylpyrimidine transport system permease protein
VLRRYLPSALLLLAAIGAWQAIASLESVDDLTLASPVETVGAFGEHGSLLFDNAWTTLVEVLLGLAAAIVLGAGAAIAMHLRRSVREAAYPLLIASQAIPIVVVAPLLIIMFDYGIGPKIAIVALICFFPVTINLLDGLRSVAPEQLKLMRSLGASRAATLWKVELPSSLPFLFSGLKIAATVSVIGAVFGEWAGADAGLGRQVRLDLSQLETPRLFAGVVLLSLMALALFVLTAALERAIVRWERA